MCDGVLGMEEREYTAEKETETIKIKRLGSRNQAKKKKVLEAYRNSSILHLSKKIDPFQHNENGKLSYTA